MASPKAGSGRPPIRLVAHLVLSHSLPLVLLVGALAVTLWGLSRMTGALGDILSEQLSTVDTEEELHRTAWGIEVALRHERLACEAEHDRADAGVKVEAARAQLELTLHEKGRLAPVGLAETARRYLELAQRVAGSRGCPALLDPEVDRLRAQLDEQLTDQWIDRLHVLHTALEKREESARSTGSLATAIGVLGGLLSWLVAGTLAWSTARAVARPLASLGRMAAQLGEGVFVPMPPVEGAREVIELARELERMRVKLLEVDSLKRGFVASVSHELRTPLAKIRESLSLLADGTVGPLTQQQQRVIALGRRACEQEVHIVSTLLDLSRMRSGSTLQRESVSLDTVVAAAISAEQPEPDEPQVRIESLANEPSPRLFIDGSLVERAVANLLRNAVAVSEAGQRVTVTRSHSLVGPDGAKGSWTTITVSDEGPGVPASIRPTLFTEFVSTPVGRIANDGSKRRGVGLGLAFSREVARAHGGDLRLVETAVGATFTLWIPNREVSSSTASEPA